MSGLMIRVRILGLSKIVLAIFRLRVRAIRLHLLEM